MFAPLHFDLLEEYAMSQSLHLSLSLGPKKTALKPDRYALDPSGEGAN